MLLAVLLLQLSVNLLVLLRGGVISETERNSFYILGERAANRAVYLETDMVQRWSNTREGESDVLRAVSAALAETGAGVEALGTDSELCQRIVSAAAPDIISMLRRNGVTGAFLVLDCPGAEGAYPGFYVRDYDPSSYSDNNTDLLMERGLPAVAREISIPMDSYWSAFFRLDDPGAESTRFFFEPIRAAEDVDAKSRSSEYFYYWSEPFRLSGLDREVITYSIPLMWEDGTVIGVLGVDLTTDFLADQLNYLELDNERAGAYFLGVSRDGGQTYSTVCSSGPNFQAWFGQTDTLRTAASSHEGAVELERDDAGGGRTVYGMVQPLKLYNVNTPFVGDQWALIGMMDDAHLLSFPRHIQAMVLLSTLVGLALGAALMLFTARTMTRPITNLVSSLEESDPDKPITLPRLHITEIDTLSRAVENLSNAAAESAARTSKIIGMTHIPVGVFEYQRDVGRVFCSRSLFTILGWEAPAEGDAYLDFSEFRARLDRIQRNLYDEEDYIFRLPQPDGTDRWVQLFYREEQGAVLGAFQDVTRDMEAKRKMEYERDFDVLTDLYNRRAFDERVRQLFHPERRERLDTAALLMFDLDNLKYVNDNYGHDYGDRYIQAFGKSLEYFYRCRSIVGRRSGDEFNVFLYGYDSQEEVRAAVSEFWARAADTSIPLPNGEQIKVRASGGLAWYPADAEDFGELLRRADFAMYSIKHTVKGRVQEFDSRDYEDKSILIQGQDALNRLIDGRLVRYALQPVVSARDGSVYGYELLMRPQVEQLSDVSKLFRVAKSESKLLQMEELTWFEALETYARLSRAGKVDPRSRIFINSVASQTLTAEDIAKLEKWYGELLERVVIEITEDEESSGDATARKKHRAELWRAQIALDDFGRGFNSETVLINVSPDLVKVDMSIIRDIDTDPNRLELLKNLMRYTKERGIRVVAEGVETRGELETVISCGVDYIQGYYVAMPDFVVHPILSTVVEEIKGLWQKYGE